MIDSHCHIYSKEFENDLVSVVDRAKNVGVEYILMPAIDSETNKQLWQMASEYPNYCLPMAGLHPGSVQAKNLKEELALVTQNLQTHQVFAVGEIGLDFYWDTTYKKEQYDALEYQIDLALQYALPIVLHTRNAIDETLAVLKNFSNTPLTGVFHCFTGTMQQAENIFKLGFYVGIGGVITYKNSDLKNLVKDFPINKILTETDAPYLAPVPYRGKRNEPAYVKDVIHILAAGISKSNADTALLTQQNAEKLFKIQSSK